MSYFGIMALLRGLYLLRLGYDPSFLGIYYATGALTYVTMGMPSGALGTRLGTRRAMLTGGWLTVIGMSILPLSSWLPDTVSVVCPFASQVVTTAGWSLFSVNSVPALMLVTSDENRASAYALTSAVRGLGTFTGTLIGGVLPSIVARIATPDIPTDQALLGATPYAWSILGSAILGLLSIIPLTRIRGGLRPERTAQPTAARGTFPLVFVIGLTAHVLTRHLGWTTCQAYGTPYMDTDLSLPTATIGTLTSIGYIAAIFGTMLLPRMTSRWSHERILTVSTATQIGSLALMAFVPHWSAAALGLLGVQVSSSIWIPELQVFQMERVKEEWRSMAYGAVAMAMGLGFGSMSYFGGQMITTHGYRQLFATGAVLSAVATALIIGVSRGTAQRPESV